MTPSMIEKWGRPVAERGFAQVPNYLLHLNQFVDRDQRLGAVELLLLIQLVGTWWKKHELPFPSMKTLALRCGVSERQIMRTIKRLEEWGLLERVKRGQGLMTSNAYNLIPLAEKLSQIPALFPNSRPRNLTVRKGTGLEEVREVPRKKMVYRYKDDAGGHVEKSAMPAKIRKRKLKALVVSHSGQGKGRHLSKD